MATLHTQVLVSRHAVVGGAHLEVDGHVAEGLGAQGAGVVVPCVLPEAVRVHEVPARQLLRQRRSRR